MFTSVPSETVPSYGVEVCTTTTSGGSVVANNRGTSESRLGTYARRRAAAHAGSDERRLERDAVAVREAGMAVERVEPELGQGLVDGRRAASAASRSCRWTPPGASRAEPRGER
jgi:hypothetical protein